MEQHDGDGAENHDDDEAREGAAPQGGAKGDAPNLLDAVAVPGQLVGLPCEGLDAHDAREGFADDGVGARHGVLGLLGQLSDEPAEAHGRNHGHGQGAEHQQGQFPTEGHEGEQAASDDDGLANELGEHHGERVADGLDVGGDAAAKVAHTPRVEEGHWLRDHPGKGVFAEGLEHPGGAFPEEPDADEAQCALDHEHEENGHAGLAEVTGINGQGQFESALSGRGVDPDTAELAPESGHNEGQYTRQRDQHDADGKFDAVRAEVGGDAPELTDTIAVELALVGRLGMGVGRGGSASGQKEGVPLRRQS